MTEYICETCKDTCVCPDCKGRKCSRCHKTGLCPDCCQTDRVADWRRMAEKYNMPQKDKRR